MFVLTENIENLKNSLKYSAFHLLNHAHLAKMFCTQNLDDKIIIRTIWQMFEASKISAFTPLGIKQRRQRLKQFLRTQIFDVFTVLFA